MSMVRFCPHLSICTMVGILDFETFAGFSLLPLYLLLCCTNCLYTYPGSPAYRFPGCISAFLQHLPVHLQGSEAVSEAFSLLEREGERALLESLVNSEERSSAIERIVSALVEDSSPASYGYLQVSEDPDIRNIIVNIGGRSPYKWSELPFSPISTYISMGGVEQYVSAAAPQAPKVGIGVYNFALPLDSGIRKKTVKNVVSGKEMERVYVPCEYLKSAIT